MRDWLLECGVTISTLESTSTYRKGCFYCLEDHMRVWLPITLPTCMPSRVGNVKDAECIAQLLEHEVLNPSFVPPTDIRRLPMLARHRVQLMGDRTGRRSGRS